MALVETFVVRIWTPADRDQPTAGPLQGLRGIVEHVGSGSNAAFQDAEQLLDLIGTRIAGITAQGSERGGS